MLNQELRVECMKVAAELLSYQKPGFRSIDDSWWQYEMRYRSILEYLVGFVLDGTLPFNRKITGSSHKKDLEEQKINQDCTNHQT